MRLFGVTKQITDQAGKKRKGFTNALGNMIRVVEDPTGQNLSTDYIFDTLRKEQGQERTARKEQGHGKNRVRPAILAILKLT